VSLRFFKIILPLTINTFTDFLNRCFEELCFPQIWKISKVIPVQKGNTDEYRPISLVPALSKILERFIIEEAELRFGFSRETLELRKSYLKNRKSIVVNNITKSGEIYNKIGVPQGSILGPLLFSIYAEDMTGVFSYVNPHFYANDTNL
jgi:hypothetical protein